MNEPRLIPTEEQQKPAIARELLSHADRRGWVSADPPAIAATLGIPVHDVAHALWDFQKRGMMKFRESKSGVTPGRTAITALRLTTQGRAAMVAMTKAPEPTGEPEPYGLTEPVDREVAFEAPRAVPAERAAPVALADYPLISGLLVRRERLEQAAALLEQAGKDELAVAALEAAKADDLYTPLEAEAVRLWERLR